MALFRPLPHQAGQLGHLRDKERAVGASSTVPLFAVPPLSMPTVTQSPHAG